MRTLRVLRTPVAATAAAMSIALAGMTSGAQADTRTAAPASHSSQQRGPDNENYNPPVYSPTGQTAFVGTPGNPLVRGWGVYQGLAEMSWLPYVVASPDQQNLLDKIVQRPKATWFGHWQSDNDITDRVQKYIELTTGGDPDVLVQTSIFRMSPWEREACSRLPSAAEQASYKKWIDGFAAGVGDAHMAVIMQPDGPFVLCAPGNSKIPAQLIQYGVRKLSALPNTSVYIDAGAADWNRDDAKRALQMLIPMGIRWARGFALNSTHYDSTERQVRYAAKVSQALAKRGIPGKYGVVNTASNGKPFKGYKYNGPNFDNARACTSTSDQHCVTLGIPPTVDVADPKWGLNAHDRRLAARYVDAYLWFGRPWLYNQASPFDMNRALTLARTTPY
jgi:endoglucanase